MELFAVPHRQQYLLMLFHPFLHQPPNPCGQVTVQNVERAEVHYRPEFIVAYMDVGRVVLVEVHEHYDTKKSRYFGHGISPAGVLQKMS